MSAPRNRLSAFQIRWQHVFMMRLFCLALMLFGLGSCGQNESPVLTPVTLETFCGKIAVSGNPPRANDADAARRAANCFVGMFQSCTLTSLTIQEPNNVTRQFSVVRNGATCALRQAFQSDSNSPPAVADCKTARIENDALVIESCSHLGDFILTP